MLPILPAAEPLTDAQQTARAFLLWRAEIAAQHLATAETIPNPSAADHASMARYRACRDEATQGLADFDRRTGIWHRFA